MIYFNLGINTNYFNKVALSINYSTHKNSSLIIVNHNNFEKDSLRFRNWLYDKNFYVDYWRYGTIILRINSYQKFLPWEADKWLEESKLKIIKHIEKEYKLLYVETFKEFEVLNEISK